MEVLFRHITVKWRVSRITFLGFLLSISCVFSAYSANMVRTQSLHRNINEIVLSYFTVDVGAGFSTVFHDDPDWKVNGNIGGQLGVGYEMRLHGFWFATGVDFQLLNYTSKLSILETLDAYSGIDDQGKSFKAQYELDKMRGTERLLFANVPLMFGFYHRNDFYIGLGVRLGYTIYSYAQTTLAYVTSGDYSSSHYVDDFENMPTHGFGDFETTHRNNIGYKFRYALAAEIGYDILSIARQISNQNRNAIKLSVFAEYGLSNMVSKSSNPVYDPVYNPISPVTPNHFNLNDIKTIPYLTSSKAFKHKANPLYVGIKLTWMFEMNTNKCRTCW